MEIIPDGNKTLDEFFCMLPQCLKNSVVYNLRQLRQRGRECIGVLVFGSENNYHFVAVDKDEKAKATVYLSFVDYRDFVLLRRVCYS